jgi:hypothetical protein
MCVLLRASSNLPGQEMSPIITANKELAESDIEAYLLKARTVEPEKQPLLMNGSETTFVSR